MKAWIAKLAAILAVPAAASAASAGEVDVVDVAVRGSGGVYDFAVTLRHDDEGWKHYADRWEVLAPDGTVLAVRKLLHPHEDEQPFTRSLSGIRIPAGIDTVTVRGHDLVHGYGGQIMKVAVPR